MDTTAGDFERCYRAVQSRDARFDGWFFTGVTTTGIYCRPSCPAMTPRRTNVRFFPSAAAAQGAGFRACRRCRPEAVPGSPEWDRRADVTGRAMRLIADGVVDREGVGGLALRLGYSERHLHRQLLATLGAGPLALARAQRARTARLLIETTALPLTQVAFGSGFASVRQFNDTIREVFAATPTDLRRSARRREDTTPGTIPLRLMYRQPMHAAGLLTFLSERAVPGVEEVVDGAYRRVLDLPRGAGVVTIRPAERHIDAVLRLDDLRDLSAAVQRCRRLLDLDADPVAVDAQLGDDPVLSGLVAARPGIRVPGTVDGDELAARAVVGQQVSVRGARTMLGRLVCMAGEPITKPDGGLTHRFPTASRIAAWATTHRDGIGLTEQRRRTLGGLATALATGDLALDPGVDREAMSSFLRTLPGIGPWTASYIEMRALGDPDAFLATDLGIRRAVDRLGITGDIADLATRWRPWRSYAAMHLWASPTPTPTATPTPTSRPTPTRTPPAAEDSDTHTPRRAHAPTSRRDTPMHRTATIDTPTGPFSIVVDADATVIASGWTTDTDDLLALVRPARRPSSLKTARDLGPVTVAARRYFAGDLTAVDDVPVSQHSGSFIEQAWKVLRTVAPGEPVTYADLASMAGRPDAVRAAASACARNACALFVPCHRVVRTGGGLGGFRYGLAVKQWLLDHESDPRR